MSQLKKIWSWLCAMMSRLLLSWSPSDTMRFSIVLSLLLVYVLCIVLMAGHTMLVDRPHWELLISKLKKDSVSVQQLRGVIFSEEGNMIAASLPQYDIRFDFRDADNPSTRYEKDTLPDGKVVTHAIPTKLLPQDTINYYFSANGPAAQWMHKLKPEKSAAEHAQSMRNAFKKRERRYLAMRAISYLQFKELLREAPFFSKNRYQIGLFWEERPHRYRPYGENRMAAKTIGSVIQADTYKTVDGKQVNLKGHGRDGLEQTFDSLLAGREGLGFIETIKRNRVTIVEREPENGADVYTTLNMEMQRILDKELGDRILQLNAAGGWAAVMEVKTGKIKAISNLQRAGDHVQEDYNHFVQDLVDPGSTFKTVSYMILLDDGKITPETTVDTGNTTDHPSTWFYNGKHIRDDHPVGVVTAQKAMEQSSNISLAKLTTKAYGKDEQRYLDLIDKTRIFEDLKLNVEFGGAQRPRNRKKGDENWSAMSLAQISYGYETRIPGMYILNFYNAIANGGKLMRPYIVDRVVKDGDVVYSRDPEVVNPSICSQSTLKSVQRALEGVVERGTARTEPGKAPGAQSKKVKIAGKTGTAQRFANGSYEGNGHYVSFAGYFPANDPEYTCLVVIDVRPGSGNGRPGGGYMAGPVFRRFAEQIYSRNIYRDVVQIEPDSASVAAKGRYPHAKAGEDKVTADVVSELGLTKQFDQVRTRDIDPNRVQQGRVPNVKDMGATDAIYVLERAGLRVNVTGRGKVISQSIAPGEPCQKGQTILLRLD